jgi:hypothetical protein
LYLLLTSQFQDVVMFGLGTAWQWGKVAMLQIGWRLRRYPSTLPLYRVATAFARVGLGKVVV